MALLEMPSWSRTLLAGLLLYTLYYVYWQLTVGASRRRMIKEHGCKPITSYSGVNDFPEPIFGWKLFRFQAAMVRARKLLETNHIRFQQNNTRTLKLQILHRKFVMTIEPENLKAMMATSFKDFNLADNRKDAFIPLLGRGIFTTDGPAWQHSRELLRPNFVRAQVADLATFEVHVGHLMEAIPRDGSTVDLQELFFRLTIDSATEFLFGESTNCLAPGTSTESSNRFAVAFNRSQELVGIATRAPWSGLMLLRPQFKADVKYVHEFVDRYVQRGLEYRRNHDLEKNDGERYVFLHELAKRTADPVQIRSELLNVLLAGRDTTASLLSNVFFMLARRPHVWEKLRMEVDSLNGEPPTYEQIKEMKYLKGVLNESLRLHPVVPGNARMAVRDTVLPRGGGPDGKSPIFIPKKMNVAWSTYSMHRCKALFGEDAEEFKPERWETLRPGWEYLPFNGGPRICIGQQYALTEASYTTIRIMQEFKSIECRDPEPWKELLTITCASLNGTKVGLNPF